MTPDQRLLDLQNQISQLSSQLAAAQQEIHNLKQLLTNNPATHVPDQASPLLPEAPNPGHIISGPAALPPWRDPAKLAKVKKPSPAEINERRIRKAEAAARFLQPPSPNQGFTFMYYPTKTRLPIGTLRTQLKRIGINNGRILDVHYPSSHTVAFMIHLDYVHELRAQLKAHNSFDDIDFNPYEGEYLCDPKFDGLSEKDRDLEACRIQVARTEKIVRKLRPSVRYAVAAYFHEIGDITTSFWQSLKKERASQQRTSLSPSPSLASMVLE